MPGLILGNLGHTCTIPNCIDRQLNEFAMKDTASEVDSFNTVLDVMNVFY
jgi:hypothetical protein